MNCLVCQEQMEYYFTKNFHSYNLAEVQYLKCPKCGFVTSKTHHMMTQKEWEILNESYHNSYQNYTFNPDDPKWLDRLKMQCSTIVNLAARKIIPMRLPWLDFGCGDGKLSEFLSKNDFTIKKYDRYMQGTKPGFLSEQEMRDKKYDLVISTSVFEHILKRRDLDKIIEHVDENGIFALHTHVREKIPKDPKWFYLLPVHVSFFTNASMQKLFSDWGFKFSIYHPKSTMWFWFKNGKKYNTVKNAISLLNKEFGEEFFIKEGFMDYWK